MSLRILVLGAGALGGYFGGRLQQAGAEVAFLVRPPRAERLARDGLRIVSSFGDVTLRVTALTAAAPGWDVILLACKAYDLPGAIDAIRPAVDGATAILPVLNGLRHIDVLRQEFGDNRVLGGLAKIQATLDADGAVRHLNDWRFLTFGELDGRASQRIEALAALAESAPGLVATAVPDVMHRLWEKLVHLGTAAIGTVLMRASVGQIVRAGGAPFLLDVLARNAAIAGKQGYPMGAAFLTEYETLFADPTSAYTTSMLRDIEAGRATEAEHILGALHAAAVACGVPADTHAAALLHARAHDQRRFDAARR